MKGEFVGADGRTYAVELVRGHTVPRGLTATFYPFNPDFPAAVSALQSLLPKPTVHPAVGLRYCGDEEVGHNRDRLPWPKVKGIVATPRTCCGQPRFDGTRVPVQTVLDALCGGDHEIDVIEGYNLSRKKMQALYCWLQALVYRNFKEHVQAGREYERRQG